MTEPDCMIVTGDRDYWVRIRVPNGIDGVDTGEVTLPGAVRWADERGYAPTHWRSRDGHVSLIPTGIVRKIPAPEPSP